MKRQSQDMSNVPEASQFSGRPGGTGIRLMPDSSGQAVPDQSPNPGTPAGSMEIEGSSLEQLKDLLQRVIQGVTPDNSTQLKSEIDVVMKGDIPESIKPDMEILGNVVMMNSNPSRKTPGSKTPAEKAQDILKAIDSIEKRKPEMSTKQPTAQKGFNLARYAESKAKEQAEQPQVAKKKHTHGNPFRVLMGQIGKLLDHGMDKRAIVRYLSKKAVFDEETIDKAVDVVKDYNTRNEYKDRTSEEMMSEDTKQDIRENLSSEGFNLMRYSAKNGSTNLYDSKPDFTKRSTAELFARFSFLKSLQSFNGDIHSEGRKASSTTGVAQEIKAIRSALTKRGFNSDEIESNS